MPTQGDRVAERRRRASSLRSATRWRPSASTAGPPDADALRAAASRSRAPIYDPEWGGAEGAPKFPSSLPVRFLLRYHRRTGDAQALEMATRTLDRRWPRAGSTTSSAAASTATPWTRAGSSRTSRRCCTTMRCSPWPTSRATRRAAARAFADVARAILGYVARDMTSPEGAFYSATDADSLGPGRPPRGGPLLHLDARGDPRRRRHGRGAARRGRVTASRRPATSRRVACCPGAASGGRRARPGPRPRARSRARWNRPGSACSPSAGGARRRCATRRSWPPGTA